MYTGTGIYSIAQAQRLTQVSGRKIRRWLYGYQYPAKVTHEQSHRFSAPLWQPQLRREDHDEDVIGFQDLLEIRFVSAFVYHGVPLSVVRRCLNTARELFGINYPLSSGSFKTDGKTIFAQAIQQSINEGALLDLKSRQFAFKDIISPSLYAGIEYKDHQPSKWFPNGRRKHIVLDPSRQFGAPIAHETGTPTDVLYASYLAEGATTEAIQLTARAYDLPNNLVNAAVLFEEGLKRPLH